MTLHLRSEENVRGQMINSDDYRKIMQDERGLSEDKIVESGRNFKLI